MAFATGELDFSKNIRTHAYFVAAIELILSVLGIIGSFFHDDLGFSRIQIIFGALLFALFAYVYWIGFHKRNPWCLVAFLLFKMLLCISGVYNVFGHIISLNVQATIGTLLVLVIVVYEWLVVIQLIQSIRSGSLAKSEFAVADGCEMPNP